MSGTDHVDLQMFKELVTHLLMHCESVLIAKKYNRIDMSHHVAKKPKNRQFKLAVS